MAEKIVSDALAPSILPARYSKGNVAAHCPSGNTIYKTRAMRLVAHLRGRYTHRERAYIMSPRKGARLLELYAAGFDASSYDCRLVAPLEVQS